MGIAKKSKEETERKRAEQKEDPARQGGERRFTRAGKEAGPREIGFRKAGNEGLWRIWPEDCRRAKITSG